MLRWMEKINVPSPTTGKSRVQFGVAPSLIRTPVSKLNSSGTELLAVDPPFLDAMVVLIDAESCAESMIHLFPLRSFYSAMQGRRNDMQSGAGFSSRVGPETGAQPGSAGLPTPDHTRVGHPPAAAVHFLCISLYGCPLWSLSSYSIKLIEITLNKFLRRVWNFHYQPHSDIVHCTARISM